MNFRALPLAALILASAIPAAAELPLTRVQAFGSEITAEPGAVRAATARGRTLTAQAVSAIDISPDGKTITVGTMAFNHEPNVWLLSADGEIRDQRYFPAWAPGQVATLADGRLTAVGMAMSRITSPEPGVWCGPVEALFREPLKDELYQADSRESQFARWRSGAGEWRDGWLASSFGELFAHGPDWVFQPPNLFIGADGTRTRLRYEDKNQLPNHRAARMVASHDGKELAFGWICLDEPVAGFSQEKNALSVWSVQPNRLRWNAPPTTGFTLPPLPDTAAEFSELLHAGFRLGADKIVRGSIASAVAFSRDGSRVAVLEQGLWCWVRTGPVIGKWDPPIHVIPFVPIAPGVLRVFDREGMELLHEPMPEAGPFELGFAEKADRLWCWPASWFARGMAGEPWLPVASKACTAYEVLIDSHGARAVGFPGAIADAAVNPASGELLASCWNGEAYFIGPAPFTSGRTTGRRAHLKDPARLAWSDDGSFAIAGTAGGDVRRINEDGSEGWNVSLPVAPAPAVAVPEEVVPGIPVYQAGRVPKGEHAYVGDMWLLKLGREGVLVDAGGTSGFATSQARVKALGIDRVTHVLQTHSHGDHCGGAYLWRAAGARIVAPKSAALAMTWLMPMLTDYGIYPPRPVDLPLPLANVGDETDFEVAGQKFHALFVPGHSFDLTIYTTVLGGKRVAFTGDLGFETNIDIVHRCWGDAEKARPILVAIREKLLPWKPEVIFTGHGVRKFGTPWLEDLIRRTEETLAAPK
jgi:glyoxylase-like metal-dependent hydrolase (beta-lactamase superfamily II)